MSRLDLVIFGATGFTGKKTVQEAARLALRHALSWGVAGRSRDKLEAVLAELSNITGEDYSSTKIIVADVADEQSLKDMCSQAKVLVNCCGPYRHYGEPVVRAAIDSKTHYVDVSGEPQFIETMCLEYDAQARDAGVFVVSACGFDSIPNDMGVVYLQRQFDGTLNSVESYLSWEVGAAARDAASSGVLNYGTWESLVYGLGHYSELGALRKKMYPQRLPTFKPKLRPRGAIHKRDDAWCVPFLGADGSIVYRTQRTLYETEHARPVQFKPYVKMGGFFTTILSIIAASFLFLMSKTSFTRNLLLEYPRVFSLGLVTRDGPKEVVMNNTKFEMVLYGEGWAKGADVDSEPPNKKMVAKVSGVNPGYGATVVALLLSALTILKEKDSMPGTGGVLTTGVAFRNTKLIEKLNENNFIFEIIGDK